MTRYFAFSDACIKWTELNRGQGDSPWFLFHGMGESSEDWVRTNPPFDPLHLIDFPGHGDSWTAGGRKWTLHEWALLIRASIRRVDRPLGVLAHGISAVPLAMALASEPDLGRQVRMVAWIDPVSWFRKPGRLPRAIADSWPGPFETREWFRGLAHLRVPALILLTQADPISKRIAAEFAVPFPRAEVWYKEGAGPQVVFRRIQAFEAQLKQARAA